MIVLLSLPIEIHLNNSYESDFIKGAILEDYIYVEDEFSSAMRGIQLELHSRVTFKESIDRYISVGGYRETLPDITYSHPYFVVMGVKRVNDKRVGNEFIKYTHKCRALRVEVISYNGNAILEWLRVNTENGNYIAYENNYDVYSNPQKYVKLHGHKKGFPKLKVYNAPPPPRYVLPWQDGFDLTYFEDIGRE